MRFIFMKLKNELNSVLKVIEFNQKQIFYNYSFYLRNRFFIKKNNLNKIYYIYFIFYILKVKYLNIIKYFLI